VKGLYAPVTLLRGLWRWQVQCFAWLVAGVLLLTGSRLATGMMVAGAAVAVRRRAPDN